MRLLSCSIFWLCLATLRVVSSELHEEVSLEDHTFDPPHAQDIQQVDSSFAGNGERVPKINCNMTQNEMVAAGAASVQVGSNIYFVGTFQKTSINQDPVVARFKQGKQQPKWCRDDYETTGADGRATGVMVTNNKKIYVAFTVDGTQGAKEEDFRRFTADGWVQSYGQGGGPKVSVILEVKHKNGAGKRGTFVKARLSNGNANTLVINDMFYDSEKQRLNVAAQSFFSPLDIDGRSTLTCQGGSSPFDYNLVLNRKLKKAKEATC